MTRDNAYPTLRAAGRLLGAAEAGLTGEKLHAVRGSILTSYMTFSAQVIGMSRALRAERDAISREDVIAGLDAMTMLVQTPPAAVAT